MLTKPSLYDPDIRNRKKGKFYIDFELSMDRYPNNKARTYPDESRNGQQTTSTGSNTKPFRNNNIIECSRSQKSDKPGSQLSTDCDMKEPITDSVSSVSEKDKMNEPITDKVSSVSRKDKMKEPITDSVPSVSEKDKICEDLPKLSIINMDHFLVDGFKLKTSTAPFDVMRRQSTRSRHFEETLNTMNDRTLMTNDNIKSNTLNHGTSNTLDNKAAHVCDSDTDVGTDSWKSGVVMETNQENAEGKDVTIETDTKEISSGDSYQSKDKRIEKWLQSTQEPPQHSTTTVKSTSYQPQRSTTISHSSETPRRLYQTNIATLQSRDMFHSRQSFKSASSRASSCRSVPKPSPWKQQYNVTTLSNPSSLKYKSYKKSVGNYGNNYSLVHSMRKCNVGRTPPVKGDSVYQTVPDSHLMLISSTPSTRTDSPDVSAWPDQSEKTYTLTTPKRSITNVTSLKNSERSKMDKYKGSTTYNDLGKYKRDNFARERDHNNAQLKIYSLIKQEEETKHKRQLVLLHQQELQKKNQTQRSKKQSDCSSKPERIESHYSHPAVSTASHRTYGIDTARCKSAAFNGSLRKNKPVAIVTPRTVRVQPRDTTYLAITSRPVPSITKSENYHKPGFSLLGSQNTKAVKFPVSGKIEKNSWTQSKPEQSSEWDTSYRLQRQVSSILKGTSHISQLRQVSKAESFYSTLSVK
uniref:Uncharacterized protein LOC102800518 n=1 Tax=Saccoglossus kowalevskii TaxID=10224 RepID=A0ABM0MIJ0_SACKO|nr:PREDICTED: uncharacterized protein LOC102800518 [Saccoglossus kowalevskii]